MNLVCYEYVATQRRNHGTVVMSRFAGAASVLPGCILVNPWDTDELANAMFEALKMSLEDRERNHNLAFDFVAKNTSSVSSHRESCRFTG